MAKQELEHEEVQKILDREVIEPCQNRWASPVCLVTNKDGTARFCVDYKKLNYVTRKDVYTLPHIYHTLGSLRDSTYFRTLDLCSGYAGGDQQDIDKTVFVTRQGLVWLMVMSFGLCSAPSTSERLMEIVLKYIKWKLCLIYLDDIIVYRDGFSTAMGRLTMVWKLI